MLNDLLANFYERDIHKLIEEVNSFKNEQNLWKTQGAVKNSSGNLVLHIIGGLSHLIGVTLAQSGFVRDRDQEFIRSGVERKVLVAQLQELIPMITETLNALTRKIWRRTTRYISTSRIHLLVMYCCSYRCT